jgi:hypothetical protein
MKPLAMLLSFAVVSSTVPATLALDASHAQDIEAVLIHKTMFLCGDEAVLVSDPGKVHELAALLLDNPTAHHACGYHWSIRFIRPDGSMTVLMHNQECEQYARNNAEVHALLARYFQRARSSPSNFIIDLTVPCAISPSELSASLEHEGRVFFFEGLEMRLPRLTVRATAARPIPDDRARLDAMTAANEKAAEQLLTAAVGVLTQKQPAHSLGPLVDRGSYFQDGKIINDVERTVFYPVGSSLRDLPALPTGASVFRVEVPESYIAQLVTTVRLDASARASLLARHPFLRAVTRFAEDCVPFR